MNSWEQFKRMYETSIREQLVPVRIMKPEKEIGGDIFIDPNNEDFEFCKVYLNPEEQEKEMNTKVFEYCITDFNDDGDAVVLIGPGLIIIEAEDNQANLAFLRIGQRHADEITPESTVLIRPFC